MIEVPRKSVLRFFGHSLISNSEDGGTELVCEERNARMRRGKSAQNDIVVIFFTIESSAPKRIDGSGLMTDTDQKSR